MEPSSPEFPQRIDRRQALKWIGAAAAAATLAPHLKLSAAQPEGKRIGWDPALNKAYKPGDLWPLTLSDEQRRAAAALSDLILPPEPGDQAPSALGVQDFVDEWVSSPYDETLEDRPIILAGLDWIDAESTRRFGKKFAMLGEAQQCQIADDICGKPAVKTEFRTQATFFTRFRYLAASGYYTTPQGWKDIGYVGNVPTATFLGPTREALRHLGLA